MFQTDKEYMLRAIELAKKGIGAVNPNPLVGAVIVKDGTCYVDLSEVVVDYTG